MFSGNMLTRGTMMDKISNTLYRKAILDNGLHLLTSEMPHTHSVSIVFFVAAGTCYETESEVGISHFIEHLCFKGTTKRQTSKEISEAIEGIGGILNGGTDKELTVLWCKVASQHFNLALDVLVDLIRNSRFDTKDINRERQVIIEEINMSLDSPQQRVDMLIDELLWSGQPLGRDSAGKKEVVANLTRQQILDFFYKHYLANNTVLSIAGDIKHEQVEDILNQYLSDWKPDKLSPRFPSIIQQETSRLKIVARNTEQVNLCLGMPGLSVSHPDRFAVDLLSVILGEGMSSRLFIELRENQGLAYDIGSCAAHFIDSGAFFISAGVDPKRLNNALTSILNQLSRLKEGISEAELGRAKELAKGRLLLAMEDSRLVANWLGAQEILTGRILTVEDIVSFIEAVTIEDLLRIAQQLMTSEKLNLAAVGPVKNEKFLAKILRL